MKIKTTREILPSEDLYSLRFAFQDLTDEERFLFNKYGFILVDLPQIFVQAPGGARSTIGPGKLKLDTFAPYKFVFENKDSLEQFERDIIGQIQNTMKKYLQDLTEFVGENLYEVTTVGEVRKINEGAKKALDKNSPEYQEIIERNREAFEKLAKL